MAGQFPFHILREWDNSGKLLSGGKIFLYESGTYTPKAAYTDYTYTIALPNPVILDAGGAADIWLGDGAYRVVVQNAAGVQIRAPIDGITGGGGSGFGQGVVKGATVALYADLRALTTAPDTVYVSGGTAEGDGGEGWFQLIPSATDTDDGGIILVTTTAAKVYRRIFDAVIDPRWYGVKYAIGADQVPALALALGASVLRNYAVQLAGSVYLGQNLSIPSGASLKCDIDGFFVSGSAVSVTFTTGSRFSSDGVVFGTTVNPTFGVGVAPELRLSWFGGAVDDDRWAKLVASTAYSYPVIADIDTAVTALPTIPARFALTFNGGAKIVVNAHLDLRIGNLTYVGAAPIILYASDAYIGVVDLNGLPARPEWFGAVGDGTTDDSWPVHAAAQSGSMYLTKSYKSTNTNSYGTLRISGPAQAILSDNWNGGSLLIYGNLNVTTELNVSNVRLYSSSTGAINGTVLSTDNTVLDQSSGYSGYSFTVSASTISCRLINFGLTTPLWNKINAVDGALTAPVAHTTKLTAGLNQMSWYQAIKHPTGVLGPADLHVTADDPSLIMLVSPSFNFINVDDPVSASLQKTRYYKFVHASNPGVQFTLQGHFRVGSTAVASVNMGGGTSQWCMALELWPHPIYPNEWSVVFGQNF